ncbi:MAG: LysM peptidoglycan-binding domain-containing protein [Gammaproteobacteria bacterium]|nr:LysM peptidoglycan-binding domain-containing protein [Gammaproteobacteria bacterium]
MKVSHPRRRSLVLVMSTAALALGSSTVLATGTAVTIGGQEAAAGTVQLALNPSHPDTYVVKRGDTLWDISAMFLRDPWFWPEIWYANPQVANPHLIYPGDMLNLVYVDGQPRLQLTRGAGGTQSGGTQRLSAAIREMSLEDAIPAIPLEVIGAFLGRGSLLQKDDFEAAPYVVAIRDERLIGSAGNDLYVRGDVGGMNNSYNVVHPGRELVDPDDGDFLGYEGIHVGAGTIRRNGDPATMFLSESSREALEGDRLIAQQVTQPASFMPKAPSRPVEGSIVAVVDGVTQVGQYQIIMINRGSRHGLEPGNVLRVWQAGEEVTDHRKPGRISRKVRLPAEPAGLSMVFRTYDRASFALVLEATSAIHVEDVVKNPD